MGSTANVIGKLWGGGFVIGVSEVDTFFEFVVVVTVCSVLDGGALGCGGGSTLGSLSLDCDFSGRDIFEVNLPHTSRLGDGGGRFFFEWLRPPFDGTFFGFG